MTLNQSLIATLVLLIHLTYHMQEMAVTCSQIEKRQIDRNFLEILEIKFQIYNAASPLSQAFAAIMRLTSKNDYVATPPTPAGPTSSDDKIRKTVPDIILAAGYGYELHNVNTSDGYILGLFRVYRRDCREIPSNFPVLLQHGFLGSAADWFLQDADKTLPFFLVDNGFDVWIGNSRGNEYSQRHQWLDPQDKFGKFWNFSFHEMGTLDLRALIDHILDVTQEEGGYRNAINYIGHGLGTTMMYVCLSEFPCKYNKKVQGLVSLAPQALLFRTQAVFPRKLAQFFKLQKYFGGVSQLVPRDLSALSRTIVPELCYIKITESLSLCEAFYYLFTGVDIPTRNVTMTRRVLGHIPSATSLKTLLHILQHVDNPQFRQFDYGPLKNFAMYGQTAPPKYNLFQVNVASVNVYALEDDLVDFQDSDQVITELGTTEPKYNFCLFNFSHTDFLWGDQKTLTLHVKILEFLRESFVVKDKPYFECDDMRSYA